MTSKLCWALALMVFAGTVAISAQAPRVTPPVNPPVNVDAAALADFDAHINAYVALRGKADNGAPPLTQTTDPAKILRDTKANVVVDFIANANR